ncbi:hypothetical protein J3R30DRAFT_3408191 [Lentinula aciculospora]|uniref:Uncharacterized protein n=1 Tax=Lentinula aciculospora TaxID=153920 RepID=A0A9W9A0S1_9AGAR|nr:hypothetical protein J3R30DRAFT_3408191 [Lentinula aciculospora]
MLLHPITDIFNQLHSSHCLKILMECTHVDFGHSIYGATFGAEEFKIWDLTAPIVLLLVGDISCFGHTSSATIIVTDYKDMAVFFPHLEPTFERISTTQPSLALRVLSTAYLLDALPSGIFIDVPRPDMEIDEDFVLPQGPPKDPLEPLLGDEEVFATHHRHSDFDRSTLVRYRARALQFFRWHEYVSQKFSKLVAHLNDTLTTKTNKVGQIVPDIRPIYPFDNSEIPSDTATQRESPLVTARVAKLFQRSNSFTLQLQVVVAEGSERGICTVYCVQLTSIDNVPMSVSPLCLKLFDDRFQPDKDDDDLIPRWFDTVVVAETYALNEAFAYDKLCPAQGSLIPWFYIDTLPDGTILYGLLIEYIEGWKLDPSDVRELTSDRQIKMVWVFTIRGIKLTTVLGTSSRLKVVVLQRVFWMWLTSLNATSTVNKRGDVGLDSELVWKHYGEPDDWDPIQAWIPTDPGSKRMRVVQGSRHVPLHFICLIVYPH